MSRPPGGGAPRQTTAFLKRWFAEVGYTIDRRKGQNFLVDLNLLDLLVRSAAIGPDDIVLEVGTGTAALTERLAAAAARVVTVEIDPRLAQLARDRLFDAGNVDFLETDVLAGKHRLAPEVLAALERARADARGRLLLVANLPYCVATPVIANLLALPRPFDEATVTIQRELAERITAPAGSSHAGALSAWVGCQATAEIVRILPPSAFWPRPKVESAILRIVLEPDRRAAIDDLDRFARFVREIFCHRRKRLVGVLARMVAGRDSAEGRGRVETVLAELGIDGGLRAEAVAADDLVRLEAGLAAAAASGGRGIPWSG